MGFMDSIKKATGLGLTPQQHYGRAYEKAVLLGEGKYKDAVGLFKNAAKKAAEAGDDDIERRALANAALYGFVTGASGLKNLRSALEGLDEIKQVGSQTDMMPTAPIVKEISVRLIEGNVSDQKDSQALAEAHRSAAGAFKGIFNETLWTYQYRKAPNHNELGKDRYLYHLGMASWHDAVTIAMTNPEAAAEHMAKAMNGFQGCADDEWVGKSKAWLKNCRIRRTCWVCHREFQGQALHFRSFSADVSPYAVSLIKNLGQDTSSVDLQDQTVVLCQPCGTVVEHTANRLATVRVNVTVQPGTS